MTTGNNNQGWGQNQPNNGHGQPNYGQGQPDPGQQSPSDLPQPNQPQGAPEGYRAQQGYGTPEGYGADQNYGSPQGGQPGYGAPQGYEAQQQGYGAPQGARQGYGAPQGYGATPAYGNQGYGYSGQPGGYPPQKSNKNGWIIGGVIVALLVIVGVVLFFVLGGDDEGGSDGRPSKDEVLSGMESMLEDQGLGKDELSSLGVDADAVDAYFDCVVDEIYDEVSVDTLEAIAANNPNAPMPAGEESTFNNAANACLSELGY